MSGLLKIQGNTISHLATPGGAASTNGVLTFSENGISIPGSITAANFVGSMVVNNVTEFAGSAIHLTKEAGEKSYYGDNGNQQNEIAVLADISTQVSTETSRAQSAEDSLDTYVGGVSTDLSAEISRAGSAETSLDTYADDLSADLSVATSRATSAEESLDT